MKKIFGNRSVKKTPLGFCDGQQRTLVGFFVDPQKRQPRYHHTYKPVGKVHRAAASGEMDVAQLQVMVTLEEGLVNDRDYKGRTPLHFACAYGCDSAVAFLVERNCEIDACDNNNITPLMKAVQCYKRKCARILLDHQADTNIKDNCGNTALHFAIYNSDAQMTELLLQHNADIEQKTQEGLTPLLLALRENSTKVAALLINTGANIKAADEYERNALMYAVRCNSLDLFELLIEKGIDFFYKDIFDWTALRYAVEGHCTFKSTILDHQEKYFKRNAAPCSKKHSKDNSIARPFKNHISRTTWHASKKNEQHFQTKNVYESSDTKFVGDSSGTPESRDNCRKHDTEEGNIRNEEEDMNTETLNETVPLLKFDTEAKESVLKEPGEEELPLIMSDGGDQRGDINLLEF